jgi:hypothetical protein
MTRRTIIVAVAAFVAGCVAAQQGYPQQIPPYPGPNQGNPGAVYPGGGYPIGPGTAPPTYPSTAYPSQAYPNPAGPNPADAPQDQPGPPVARLSVLNGEGSVKRNGSNDWVAAVVNAPLMAGDAVATGPNGQAEIQLDAANFLRLAGDTEVRLADLSAGADPSQVARTQIQVARGLIMFRGLRASGVQTEISTPAVAVHPLGLAAVRVDVAPDGSTRITVRKGEVEASTPQGTEHIREGSMMMVRGAADDPEYQVVAAPARDGWDSFNEQRDATLERAQSNRYVSQGVNGAEDLDAAGRWGYDPQYGNVWTPTAVPQGWAPYSAGQWVWSDFYGWTWVDAAPWGWAPFHYGSWYLRAGFGWSWYPGLRYGPRAFYRPALVSFVGFGGVGVGVGFGRIGWVPLAPFERFQPWYGRGFAGGARLVPGVNVVATANIGALYRNARVANGVTAVSAQDFQRGSFRNASPVGGAELQRASLVRGALPVAPGANNFRLSDRAATVTPQGSLNSQHFFSRMGNSGGAGQPASGRFGAAVNAPANGPAGGYRTAQAAAGSGWQRFGAPAAGGGPAAAAPRSGFTGAPAGTPNSGWGRFGTPQQGNAPQRVSAPPQQYARPSYPPSGSYNGGASSRSLQVAPPIVRQREAAPSGGYGGGGGYRGGGNSGGARPSSGGGHGGGHR